MLLSLMPKRDTQSTGNQHEADYESDDEIRAFIRCLAALSHVPVDKVTDAFESLIDTMPNHERMNELVSYFEHTYI